LIPALLVSFAVLFIGLSLASPAVNSIEQRLNTSAPGDTKLHEPFTQRILHPLRQRLVKKVSFMLPKEKKEAWQKRLWQAGFLTAVPSDLAAAKLLGSTVAAGIVLLLLVLGDGGFNVFTVIKAIVPAGTIGYLVPELVIGQRIVLRKQKCDKELPDCLDLLTISVEAGLGLDAALAKVVEKGRGVLAKEFAYLLRELQMGQSRKKAWRNVASRVGTESVANFVSAVIQAEQLGVGLAQVLRSQSMQVRTKHRQKVEEKAMKAPVKMLLPLVLFIFPTMFVVLLGPALIQIIRVMSQ